jgi:phage shock protein A
MFQRIANLLKGFLGLFVSGLEKANPEALLEVEKENLRKQIANYNQGLASHAGLCERLMSQVKKLEAEERDLRAKAAANLRAGNREAAGQYALQLQSTSAQLIENRKQLEAADKTYQDLIRARDVAIKAARDKIESLKYALTDLKIKKATAEMNEMASGMVGSIGGSGGAFDRREVAGGGRSSHVCYRETGGFSGRGIDFCEEGNQSAVAMKRAGVAKAKRPPFRVAEGGPTTRVLCHSQDLRPSDRFLAPTERLRHRLPHCDDHWRKHQVFSGADKVLASFDTRLGIAQLDESR